MPSLAGRTALVTGASSGIGHATALALREAGANVIATARDPRSIADLASLGMTTRPLDVTDAGSRNALRDLAGDVDVLVNNAGYGLNGAIEELDSGDLEAQFATNVFGLVAMTQLVLPGMRDRGRGRIINIGSIGGTIVAPGAGAYHASKFAVEAISDALRMEVSGFGIQVALLKPTGVHTRFAVKITGTLRDTGPDSPYAEFNANMNQTVEKMFSGRAAGIITPEQVARTVVRAATARRARSRYLVGASAYIYFAMRRLLSDRAWDAVIGRQFPPPKPSSEPASSAQGSSTGAA